MAINPTYCGRRASTSVQCVCAALLLAIAVALAPEIALAQDSSVRDDSYRRIIFVPGVDFGWPINDEVGPFNACERAWGQARASDGTLEGGTFSVIAQHLTQPQSSLAFGRHVYRLNDFLAFSYHPDWTPLGSVQSSLLPEPDRTITEVDQCSDRNGYTEAHTHEHVALSAIKFEGQIRKWRADCPFCRFDIISHSLGGAVVTYWAAVIAREEDLAYIHNSITINSPINGISWATFELNPLFIRLNLAQEVGKQLENFVSATGDAGAVLRGREIIGATHQTWRFLPDLKAEPPRIDMTCIGNTYEALIVIEDSTRETCYPFRGPYSKQIDWKNLLTLKEDIDAAHSEPLRRPEILRIIDLRLALNDRIWIERAPLRTEPLADRDAHPAAFSPFPIVLPSAPVTMTVTMKNWGVLPWNPADDRFVSRGGTEFDDLTTTQLTSPVNKSGTHSFELSFTAPKDAGVYSSEWQMAFQGQPYGSKAFFTVVVLTEEQRNPGGFIRALFSKALADTVAQIESLVEEGRQQVERLVRQEIERQIARLIGNLCGTAPAAVTLVSGYAWIRRKRK